VSLRWRGTRRRRPRVHPLAIALGVIAAAAFITYYAFNQGLPFQHQFTLYAVVDNSVDVNDSSPVRIAGIDVGHVTGVQADGEYTRIAFTVDSSGRPVHRNATVVIRDRLFLEGSYYLQLDPGTPDSPIVHDGFTIEPQNTASPVQFYKVLSVFDLAARQALVQTVGALDRGLGPADRLPFATSGAAGLKRAIPELTPVARDTAWISQALSGSHAGDVARLLSSSASLTATLNDSGAQLDGLIAALYRSASALASDDGALAATVRGVDATLRAAPPALRAVDRALAPTEGLARALTPALRVSPPLLTRLTGLVRELTAIIAAPARPRLLTALRTTFVQFPSMLTQFASAFPATAPVSECLDQNVLKVLNAQVPDGVLTSGEPVWKDFVHFLPNVAGASGNFDGDGHYTRVLAGFGSSSVAGPAGSALQGLIPGGGTLSGVSPHWIGDLTPSDFRPDVRCSTQRVPSLAVVGSTAPDLGAARRSARPAPPVSAAERSAALARAEGRGWHLIGPAGGGR
jgi:phospholipid/cholesterol/gamma-HCH transport system substrate-binding protein